MSDQTPIPPYLGANLGWTEITVPHRPDIIGVRDLPGTKEYLLHNKAMCFQYYVVRKGQTNERR
jgi:hypothetical protein